MTLDLSICLYAAAAIFSTGLYGVLSHRNVLVILMSVQLMLGAGNLALVSFGRGLESTRPADPSAPQVLTLLVVTVAAAQAAVGFAMLFAMFRKYRTIDVDAHSRGK